MKAAILVTFIVIILIINSSYYKIEQNTSSNLLISPVLNETHIVYITGSPW